MNHQFQIRVHSGELRGQAFVISQPEFKIGRDPSCDIVLGETAVSRIHAIIYSQGVNTLVLADNNSTNGTTINNVQVTSPVQISENDVIMLGGEVALALEKIPAGMGVAAESVQPQAAAPAQQIPPYFAPADPSFNGGTEPLSGQVPPAPMPAAADPLQSSNPQFQPNQTYVSAPPVNPVQNPYGVISGDPNLQFGASSYSAPIGAAPYNVNPYAASTPPQSQYPQQPGQAAMPQPLSGMSAYPGSQFSSQQQPAQGFDPNNPYGQQPAQGFDPNNPYGQQPAQGFDPNNPYGQQPAQGFDPNNPYGQQPAQGFDPNNPYGQQPAQGFDPNNPYAQQPAQGFDPNNPYGQQPAQGFDPNNPYAQQPTQGFDPNNPYAQQQSAFAPGNPYGQPQMSPYGQQPGPYGYAQQPNPYAQPGPYGYPDQGYGQPGYDGAEAPVKSKKLLFIILGIVLAVILIIVILILYVDANYLWCDWFPFLWSAEACQNYPPLQ